MKALITVSYDGTDYCGWQIQQGQVTIQSVIEGALQKLYNQPIRILGASRTDSGVHALCQKASFTPPDERISPERIFLAINSMLPPDIRVMSSEQVSNSFHVINDVKNKTYVYNIQNTCVHDPTRHRFSHHIKEPLNFEAMNEAAAFFLGKHDFKGFRATHGSASTTVRTVYRLSLNKMDGLISLEINGNGFLYNMVRIIAGTLVEVGLGKIEPASITGIIESGRRENAGKTLPAKGLMLTDIKY